MKRYSLVDLFKYIVVLAPIFYILVMFFIQCWGGFSMREYLNKKELTKSMFIFISSLILIVFFMFGMLSILKLRIYSSVVTGSSMEKNLPDETKILFIKANLIPIKRGDIVSVNEHDPILGDFHYLKRVIALPNGR